MFLISLLSLFLHAEPAEIPTVVIEGHPNRTESTRSVMWTTTTPKTNPAIRLPLPEDSLNAISGLQTRTQGSPTFSIRGSAQSGRALVLYDHIPLNFASGIGAPRIFLAKETLGEVVVIKGPASLFYGSQAMAGAIDFVEKTWEKPEFILSFSDTDESFLPWRKGTLGNQSYQFATPLINAGKTFLQASLFYEDDDGIFPYQTQTASGVRDFNASNLSRLVIKGHHLEEKWRIDLNSILGRQIQHSPGAVTNPVQTRQETQGYLVSASPQFFVNEQNTLKSRISYMQDDSDYLENSVVSFNNQQTWIFQNEWIYDLSSKTKLQVFADYFFHKLDNSFVGQDLKQDNFEMGPLLSFHTSDSLMHQVGGRYLFRNDKLLPSITTHYFREKADFWISYSEGFRNPTLSDLYSNSPNFVGNPDLEPEVATQYELGVRSSGETSWQWDFRGFHMEYESFIESVEVSPNVFTRINQGSGYSRGFESEVRWSNPIHSFGLSYNYLDTKNRREGRSFRLSPRHQITLDGLWKLGIFELLIQNIHWYDVIDVSLNTPVELEDWQQWNFFFTYRLRHDFFIQLGLINAFNEGKQLTLNYPEPQRRYWLQVRKTF